MLKEPVAQQERQTYKPTASIGCVKGSEACTKTIKSQKRAN